jgi:hypothetical protein
LDELVPVAGLLVEKDEDGGADIAAALTASVTSHRSTAEWSVKAVHMTGSPTSTTLLVVVLFAS